MTAGELKEILEMVDDDTEVRLASQPSWPLEYAISDLYHVSAKDNVLYLAEERQLGYLSGEVAESLGWGR